MALNNLVTLYTCPCAAGTAKEHLGLAMALRLPFFIVVSKDDVCSASTVERTVRQLTYVLRGPGCARVPFLISSSDDAMTAATKFSHSPRYVPAPFVVRAV